MGDTTIAERLDLLDRLIEEVWAVADALDDSDRTGLLDEPTRGMALLSLGAAARRCGVTGSRLTHAADRLAVRAATELLATRAHRHDASTTPARWIEYHLGVSRRDAQRTVRVARLLGDLPALAEPFSTGEVRLGHLDAIARIIPTRLRGAERVAMTAALAECTGELTLAATRTPLARFERFCAAVRDRLDPDGTADRRGDPSRVHLSEGFGGRWVLSGDLAADDGAQLAAYLEQRTRRTLLAHNRGDSGSDPASGPEGTDADPALVMSEVRADALVSLCRDGARSSSPGRIALNLHIDLADLRTLGPDPLRASTGAGSDITESTLWALLADADVRPIFCDGATPLSYGRTRRLAPDILRTVLAHRQPRCGVAGCDAPPPWHRHHHLQHWSDGGPTDADNVTGACGPHHRGHHRGDWTIRRRPDDGDPWDTGVAVSRPDGSVIAAQPLWSAHAHDRNPARHAVLRRLRRITPRPPPSD